MKSLILMASKIPHKKELGLVCLKPGEGITGWVAKTSKPVFIGENAYADSRFKALDVLHCCFTALLWFFLSH